MLDSSDGAMAEVAPAPSEAQVAFELDYRCCRISGLRSDAGKRLNGSLGCADVSRERLAAAGPDDRLPVHMVSADGTVAEEGQLLKRSNLRFATSTRDVTAAGVCHVLLNPFGRSHVKHLSFGSSGPTKQQLERMGAEAGAMEELSFDALAELPLPLRFLLACGPLSDLGAAEAALSALVTPALLLEHQEAENRPANRPPGASRHMVVRPASLDTLLDVDIPACTTLSADVRGGASGLGQLRAPGVGLTALEWAAKCGNLAVAEWLCTDERTRILLNTGSPVGWACYAGHVDVARLLSQHGADPSATDVVLWKAMPPVLATASVGQAEALEWLVDEMGVSIHTTDDRTLGILHHIHTPDDWEARPGHVACDEFARAKGAKKQHFRNFKTK
jgi:hypothetical protein